MKKGIGKNYIYNLSYEILTVLVPLVTTPYISRVLGAKGIGIYSFTYSIATYFALFAALGTTVYARRETAYFQDKPQERSVIFWEIVVFRSVMTLICLLLYGIYVFSVDYKEIGLIQAFYVVAVVFDVTWFFQGMEDFGTVVLRNSIIKIINVIFIFVFVHTADDLNAYIFGLAFLPLIGNIVTWSCIPKYISKVPLKKLHPCRHIKGAISLFIPTIASQVYLLLDKTMLGVFAVSSVENGYYEQAQKIIKICWMFVTAFALVMSPRIAYAFANNDDKKLRTYMKKSFNVIWFLATPITFGMAGIASNMVPWFFGNGFEKVTTLLLIFSVIVIPVGLSSVTGSQYLVATKKQKVYTISILVGAVLNFGMNIIFIPKFFSVGAAIASVFAEFIIAIIQIIYITFVIKKIKISDIIFTSWHYLLSGIIMYSGVRFLSKYLTPTAVHTLILIGTGAVLYFVSLILLKDNLITEGLIKIKKKIVSKINFY